MPNFDRENQNHIERYQKSLPADRLELFGRYEFHDAAVKVVGVGSVGTRCYIELLFAEGEDPLFLQTKEARRSVLESSRGKSRFANQGFRVVTGQRLMQAASDIFLGWFRSAHGHDYYVRQFRDMKVAVELETFRPGNLAGYATACGWALARAHAKAGDAPMIAGYWDPPVNSMTRWCNMRKPTQTRLNVTLRLSRQPFVPGAYQRM